jgi:hypothetical protein
VSVSAIVPFLLVYKGLNLRFLATKRINQSILLYGFRSALTGADADRLLDRRHKDLAVADLVGARRLQHCVERSRQQRIVEDDLDFDLGQEVDDVLGAAMELGMALLAAETAHSATVSPVTPISCNALFTSSSLNGLMMASIFFIA